ARGQARDLALEYERLLGARRVGDLAGVDDAREEPAHAKPTDQLTLKERGHLRSERPVISIVHLRLGDRELADYDDGIVLQLETRRNPDEPGVFVLLRGLKATSPPGFFGCSLHRADTAPKSEREHCNQGSNEHLYRVHRALPQLSQSAGAILSRSLFASRSEILITGRVISSLATDPCPPERPSPFPQIRRWRHIFRPDLFGAVVFRMVRAVQEPPIFHVEQHDVGQRLTLCASSVLALRA